MDNLAQHFRETLLSRKLVEPKDRLLIAVSGGVDSMALLDLLHELSDEYELQLRIAHLNHGLRGRSSDADERLVQKAAARLGIPVATAKADVRSAGKREGTSIEMAARKARHEFLKVTARRFRARKIVMAHHADDQVELFFIRLLRGAGLEGLGGMKWSAKFPGDANLQIIRPLLATPKAALREYAARRRIAFREDATNTSLDIQRNRIRNELLPLLRLKYHPNVAESILRTMELARDESEWTTSLAKEWLAGSGKEPREDFSRLPVPLQRHCVRIQLRDLGVEGDYSLIERLRLNLGKSVTVPRPDGAPIHVALIGNPGRVELQTIETPKFTPTSQKTVTVVQNGSTRVGQVDFSWEIVDWRGSLPARTAGVELFDADAIGRTITLRHWLPGDRFQPIGMTVAVKLQDFFTNQKVPRARRHELMLGITEANEICWVEGMRIGERFKLTDKTIRCLQWRWNRL